MQSDDIYRTRLEATIAALRYWLPSIAHVADIQENDPSGGWHVSVRPHIATACPFELLLRQDQHYDILVGDEGFDDCPIDSLDVFPTLVSAIANGHVQQRTWTTAATGTVLAVETTISLPKMGNLPDTTTQPYWHRRRTTTGLSEQYEDLNGHCLSQIRAFAPYQFKEK